MFPWLTLKPWRLSLVVTSTFTLLLIVIGSAQAMQNLYAYRWYQGDQSVPMVPIGNSACFLTTMQGKFQGSGEVIRIIQRDGFWFLEGESGQEGVAARARCITGYKQPIEVLGEFEWKQEVEYPTKMVPTYKTACFLTAIQGKFQGSGEAVKIFPHGGYWWLTGESGQKGVGAKAICISSQEIWDVSNEYEWHQDQGKEHVVDLESSPCFLTKVSGKFMGGGELVTIDYSSIYSRFTLGGKSGQKSVQAGARCIRY